MTGETSSATSGARPRVLRLGRIDHAQDVWEKLSDVADLVEPKSTNRADFIEECKSGALDGVVSIYRTFSSLSITGRIDEELLKHMPKSLRFISHVGAGYDQVDVNACAAANIRVSNTPGTVDDATADNGIFLMLGALRNFWPGLKSLREGNWRGNPLLAQGHDPQGKILGILGMGGIGRNMAKKARVFDMEIQYYNRTRLAPEIETECGAKYVSFDELLATSDVISLSLPLNPNTRHTISTPEFAKMKKGVVIVNTARGAVMDEVALVKALDDGIVASAGLDVFEHEPKIEQGLIDNPNVILLPHLGTWTIETSRKMEVWALDNVRNAVEKGKLLSIVPEHKALGWE